MDEESVRAQIKEAQRIARDAIAQNTVLYDQNLAMYRDSLQILMNEGDAAHHLMGNDLVVPSVGAVIFSTLHDLVNEDNLTPEQVQKWLIILLSVAVKEIIDIRHGEVIGP